MHRLVEGTRADSMVCMLCATMWARKQNNIESCGYLCVQNFWEDPKKLVILLASGKLGAEQVCEGDVSLHSRFIPEPARAACGCVWLRATEPDTGPSALG